MASDASARPERFQLNWVGHFHAVPGFQSKLVGRFGASRGLQLINTRVIPNTALFGSFLAGLCDVRRIMQIQAHGVPKRPVVFGVAVTTWRQCCAVRRRALAWLFRLQPGLCCHHRRGAGRLGHVTAISLGTLGPLGAPAPSGDRFVSAGLRSREKGSRRGWRSETVPTRPVCGNTQIVTQ